MQRKCLPYQAKNFCIIEDFANSNNNILLLFADEKQAEDSYKQLSFFTNTFDVLYLPTLYSELYDRSGPTLNTISHRATVLSYLAMKQEGKLFQAQKIKPTILVTNSVNLLYKLPPAEILRQNTLHLLVGMEYSAKKLADFLVSNGFSRSVTAIDKGEFAVRGEIVDIILESNFQQSNFGYRVNFAFNAIDSIKIFDINTQISVEARSEILISPASEIILREDTIANFKNNYLQLFGINGIKSSLYQAIVTGQKFAGSEYLLPLFYNTTHSIIEYLLYDANNSPNLLTENVISTPIILYDNLALHSIEIQETSAAQLYDSVLHGNKQNPTMFYPAISPSDLFFPITQIKEWLKSESSILLDYENSERIKLVEDFYNFIPHNLSRESILLKLIQNNPNKLIIISYQSNSNFEKLKNLIQNNNYKYYVAHNLSEIQKNHINLCQAYISNSFITKDFIFLLDQDILGKNFKREPIISAKHRLKNIISELDNFQEGELVVHKDHGIGKFLKVEMIYVMGRPHDCIKIEYADNNKLYIPVENLELIKKYGESGAQLDKLGGSAWQKRKAQIKNRIKDIADKLIQTTAKRKLTEAMPLSYDQDEYEKFCQKFQYIETDDQLKAIEEVNADLKSGQLMDRLVCGDVGFGKTEVALRAAYMVAKNIYDTGAQVAIIVPTTILCKQHYLRFASRFEGFNLNISMLSRLVNSQDARLCKEKIKSGEINIIIGTHALFTKDIVFKNLQLLIIDEEQHFGVTQKEYLKTLKSNLHVLSLSATPIPRTLQMSMVGLKELSLIATPPINRLVVRTTVMKFDPGVIRDALMKEHLRGGRSFYVCPRIEDIKDIEEKLKLIVPELRYKVAHGKMAPTTVDSIMVEFYDGKFDILLCTSIIESGIDIPEANTLIIHKATYFGLSQLYQLRGRIGRNKIRGYAYLIIENNKNFTKEALKRLEIIQSIDTLGGGFIIASHDMDLRGFGNLVGEEQSGQIKEVGVELYQEMLDEAIMTQTNLEPEKQKDNNLSSYEFIPTINLPIPVFIDQNYISDSALRLSLYRRIANLIDLTDIEKFQEEMCDRFGPIPYEFDNLLQISRIKQKCYSLNIDNIDSGPQGFILKFYNKATYIVHNQKQIAISDMIMDFIHDNPKEAKIKPGNKLIFVNTLTSDNVLRILNGVLDKLLSYLQ